MSNQAGIIYPTKSGGDLEVTKYINSKEVEVRFLATGHKKTTQMSQIRSGKVKDPFYPSVFGVGFIGIGDHSVLVNGKHTKSYTAWNNMLKRCYSENFHNKNPTYIGCNVCEDWHNFQVFAKWYYENYPSDGGSYQLDKDIKVKGNKTYKPESCMFVTKKDNVIKANAKKHEFVNPDGEVVIIYNLQKFCRDNDLHRGTMFKIYSGERKSHKGWTKP